MKADAKVPEAVQGAYRDLRDRHLLPVVALLIVAIIAVPMLLGGSSRDTVSLQSSAALSTGSDLAPEASPVVLTEVPMLRDFYERLDMKEARNPFRQQYAAVPDTKLEDAAGGTDATDGPLAGVVGDVGEDGDVGGVDGIENPIENPIDPSLPAPPDVPEDPAEDDPDDPVAPPEDVGPTVITFQIDVRVGSVGATKKQEGVKSLEYLPGDTSPVVQYITSDLDGTRASFVVNNGVTGSEGTGSCAPDPESCQFLFLEVGQEQRLYYEPADKVFRLKLTRITRVERPLEATSGELQADSAYSFITE